MMKANGSPKGPAFFITERAVKILNKSDNRNNRLKFPENLPRFIDPLNTLGTMRSIATHLHQEEIL